MLEDSYAIIIGVEKPESTCLVEMPYGKDLEWVFRAIQTAALELDLRPRRISQDAPGAMAPNTVIEWTRSARIVVAVCNVPKDGAAAEPNPNVMYETGLAVALGKPTLLLRVEKSKLPFDIDPIGGLDYGSPEQEAALAKSAKEKMKELLDGMKDEQLVLTRAVPSTQQKRVWEAHARCRLLLQTGFWKSFGVVFRHVNGLRSEMELVCRDYALGIKNIEDKLAEGNEQPLDSSQFSDLWKKYLKHYDMQTKGALEEPDGFTEALADLNQMGETNLLKFVRSHIKKLSAAQDGISGIYEKFFRDPRSEERCLEFHTNVYDFVSAVDKIIEYSAKFINKLVDMVTEGFVEPQAASPKPLVKTAAK